MEPLKRENVEKKRFTEVPINQQPLSCLVNLWCLCSDQGSWPRYMHCDVLVRNELVAKRKLITFEPIVEDLDELRYVPERLNGACKFLQKESIVSKLSEPSRTLNFTQDSFVGVYCPSPIMPWKVSSVTTKGTRAFASFPYISCCGRSP